MNAVEIESVSMTSIGGQSMRLGWHGNDHSRLSTHRSARVSKGRTKLPGAGSCLRFQRLAAAESGPGPGPGPDVPCTGSWSLKMLSRSDIFRSDTVEGGPGKVSAP